MYNFMGGGLKDVIKRYERLSTMLFDAFYIGWHHSLILTSKYLLKKRIGKSHLLKSSLEHYVIFEYPKMTKDSICARPNPGHAR